MQRHSTCWCVHIRVCVFQCVRRGTHLDLLFVFIDASKTVCKVTCLLFVEIDEFDVPDTENVHCAKLPDAQDNRICWGLPLNSIIIRKTLPPLLISLEMARGGGGGGTGARPPPPPQQWLQAWVYPYYFLACQSPFSCRFHHEGAHLGTIAWESI